MRRRVFLGMIAGLGIESVYSFSPMSHPRLPTQETIGSKSFLPKREETTHLFSASDDENGQHFLSHIDVKLNQKNSLPIPFRAHDILALSGSQAIAFGRRPHPQSIVVDMNSGEIHLIEASTERHFYGHGCLSEDKSLLFTTENDYNSARGVIGVRDTKTFRQIGEYSSYGVGPHDLQLMPDGKTLVVANGGIRTHPDYGRRKLSLKTMQPSLVYVDIATGQKLNEYRLDDHLLSIRHLVVTDNGDVGIAMQYQGDMYRQQPKALTAWQSAGGSLKTLPMPENELESYHGYMADLAYDSRQKLLAVTSPRGNRIAFWDIKKLTYLYSLPLPEASGIQYLESLGQFVVSSAQGKLFSIRANIQGVKITDMRDFANTHWDNHLFALTI